MMMWSGLIILVLVVLWVANLSAVAMLTGALGLRRRRWGTPGGGWAMVSAGLLTVAGLGVVALYLGLWLLAGPGPGATEIVVIGSFVTLGTLWAGSHLALAQAIWTAWKAADAAVATAAPSPRFEPNAASPGAGSIEGDA